MNTRNSMVREFLLALALTVLAASAEKPEGLVASAKEYLAKGDQKAAVIQLRSALQKNNDLAEARFLLGRALLDIDD
jgi:tetratricopeptide (TPR) repeat protein